MQIFVRVGLTRVVLRDEGPSFKKRDEKRDEIENFMRDEVCMRDEGPSLKMRDEGPSSLIRNEGVG